MKLPDDIRVLERGWLSSNNILFLDDNGATVVDTGYVSHGDETLRLIDEALQGRTLRRIINTHLHSDHAGGNALLQARHGCEVWIPPLEADLVDQWDEERLSYRRTGQQCPRFSYDALIHPHQTLHLGGQDWTVLPAAGHDHAMVMLWCERLGILISADALWQKGFGVIFPELAGVPGFAQQKATLDLIGQLQPRLVIPGHGAPFTEVDAALQTAQSRIQWMTEEPRRNTDNALKVMLAFKLLEARQMTMAELTDLLRLNLAGNVAMRTHYPQDPEAMAAVLAEQLVRAGAATRDGDQLTAVESSLMRKAN